MNQSFVSFVIGCLLAAAACAQNVSYDVGMTNGPTAQRYLGVGKSVVVSILDGGIDAAHPALRAALYKQRDFTGQAIYDDMREDIGHGTGVAGIILGNDPRYYVGIAPSARFISARVETTGGRETDETVGTGLIWSARNKARIANLSIGNPIGNGRLTDRVNLIADYLTEKYGMHIVSAAGNDAGSAVNQAPGANYNGYSVGALAGDYYERVWNKSNYATTMGRSKPDLVAPGEVVTIAAADWEKQSDYYVASGTSFAAPMVSGVLAQLVGYGKARNLSTSPVLMKAILLTSATKVRDRDGAAWQPSTIFKDDELKYRTFEPLDDEQGAGRVDAFAAYRIYAGFRAKSTPITLWREKSLKGNESATYRLGQLAAGQRVDATLTWYRHIGLKDRAGDGPDWNDRYYYEATLADFTLTLLKDGAPVAASDSDVDNLEHLSWMLTEPGYYSLQVYRFSGKGLNSEAYAIAARVLNGETATYIPGAVAEDPEKLGYSPYGLVPEPGGLSAILVAALLLGRRGRATARGAGWRV